MAEPIQQAQDYRHFETLIFRKNNDQAVVVTDGLHSATYEENGRIWHPSLTKAIGHLEARGYQIIVDLWRQ